MIPRSQQPNEFNPEEEHLEQTTGQESLPEHDFFAEELAFAQELNSLFNLEAEELPPLFIQTLRNEQTDLAAPARLEQRLRYRVFRKLQLPQRILNNEEHQEQTQKPRRFLSRPRALSLSALLATLLICLLALSPSAISWAQTLLAQTSQQTAPAYSQQAASSLVLTQYLSIREAQEAVPFDVYWLGNAPENYNYRSLLLHMGQNWSNGPVVEVEYGHDDPHIGYGRLTLREFRPEANTNTILQVVPPDAFQAVQLPNNTQAIYITGQWTQENGEVIWDTGTQVQLLYQAAGLVFWITADQRDQISADRLIELISESMQPLYLGPPRSHLPEFPDPPRAQSAPALSQPVVEASDRLSLVTDFPETRAAVYIALSYFPDSTE